jgi:hypothetical protein
MIFLYLNIIFLSLSEHIIAVVDPSAAPFGGVLFPSVTRPCTNNHTIDRFYA